MNYQKLFLDYGLFALIIVVALALFSPYLVSALGPSLGTAASYVSTAAVAMVSLWIHRKLRKKVD